jgi:catechol 2,3-dioxygenase-like lactoylglutathione lyase family enzyme
MLSSAVVLTLLGVPARVGADDAGPVEAVAAVVLPVADLGRSERFFEDVLGFERLAEVDLAGAGWERLEGLSPLRGRAALLRLGEERIELVAWRTPPGRPLPLDSRSNDRWFQHVAIVVRDMDRAYAALSRHGVVGVSVAPQRLPDSNPVAGGIRAYYFHDPDDHVLELLWFPPGKGDPRWQRRGDRLFLGVDHTAIAVADTAASLAFYRDWLGLRVVGASENFGPEQERLNAVAGAHLRITSLRAGHGPGIELLEYLAPRDGRPRPPGIRSSDLLAWQTALVARDPAALARALASAGATLAAASPPAALPRGELGFRLAFLASDPDGHLLRVTDREGGAP